MVMDSDAYKKIIQHLRRVDDLLSSEYVKHITTQETGIIIHFDKNGFDSVVLGPPVGQLKQAILDFRLLYQSSGNRKWAEFIDVRSVSDHLKVITSGGNTWEEYESSRRSMNDWLDRDTILAFKGEHLTRRQVFDTWIWGRYAHECNEPAEKLQQWRDHLYGTDLFDNEFRFIFGEFCKFFMWSRDFLRQAIRENDDERPNIAAADSTATKE